MYSLFFSVFPFSITSPARGRQIVACFRLIGAIILFTCCAAAVVSFGTHLLMAQYSAASSERRLHLRLAVDNLLLVSYVGKVQQGSSLSRAGTSSIPRSVAHYT